MQDAGRVRAKLVAESKLAAAGVCERAKRGPSEGREGKGQPSRAERS